MALTITDRIAKHNQMKARLAEKESKIRLDERKARTRRLIEAGGLVEKAGLADLDNNTLYGALLSMADGASEKGQREKWARLGEKATERETKAKARDTLPFVLSFPAAVPKEVAHSAAWGGLSLQQDLQALGRSLDRRDRPGRSRAIRGHRRRCQWCPVLIL